MKLSLTKCKCFWFFLGERSEAYSHKDTPKWFRFLFSRPWHPSAIHLFESNVLGTNWSDFSDFCITTMMGLRSIKLNIFGRRIFFRRVICEKKFNFRIFSIGQRLYLWVLYLQEAWKRYYFWTNRWNTIQLTGVQ